MVLLRVSKEAGKLTLAGSLGLHYTSQSNAAHVCIWCILAESWDWAGTQLLLISVFSLLPSLLC